MLSVVTWKWTPAPGYRSSFTAAHVNVLRRMVARHYAGAHRFLCVTDDAAGLDPEVMVVPPWNDFAGLPSPWGPRQPSCYRRLRAFAPDIATVFGARFVSLDLDVVVTGDLAPLWDRSEDFVIWGDTAKHTRYNGSMFLLRAGARPQVWTSFDPTSSPQRAKAAGQFGSDQGWISYVLGPAEAKWSTRDGVYSYRNEIAPKGGALPPNARMVIFHGAVDPWSKEAQRLPWVREHYR